MFVKKKSQSFYKNVVCDDDDEPISYVNTYDYTHSILQTPPLDNLDEVFVQSKIIQKKEVYS